jgi:hypothetical protein
MRSRECRAVSPLGGMARDVWGLVKLVSLTTMLADGFTELPVRFAHSLKLESLPRRHDDPFDRMLIAQSIADARTLVTKDAWILSYAGVAGFDVTSG